MDASVTGIISSLGNKILGMLTYNLLIFRKFQKFCVNGSQNPYKKHRTKLKEKNDSHTDLNGTINIK